MALTLTQTHQLDMVIVNFMHWFLSNLSGKFHAIVFMTYEVSVCLAQIRLKQIHVKLVRNMYHQISTLMLIILIIFNVSLFRDVAGALTGVSVHIEMSFMGK